MKALAAVMRGFSKPLVLEEVEIPRLAPGQVLVEMEAAGVCGSDVHMWRGRDPRTPLPMIPGHEGVGRVADLNGPKRDVHGLPVALGDRIIWDRGVTCGHCYYCAVLKEPLLCPHRWVYGIHRSLADPPHLDGCYASHLMLDSRTHLLALDDDEDPALFVAASCSGATAAHVFDLSPVRVGDVVVVLGPGPLGAFCVALARAGGAEQVVVVGGTATRLDLCRRLGATVILNRGQTDAEERAGVVQELTHGRGVDLVVEASGSLEAALEGLRLLRDGGTLSLVGFGTPVGDMTFPPFELVVRKNARIQGVWVSDARHLLTAVSLVRQRRQEFSHLVTHRFALGGATLALEAVAHRQAMKAVLLPGMG
ncbi:MAG TPA: zinc-binding dehydrogenase [Anaerolineae bacterium]|nr:zinc-binding dehydrogenase [Anaerolineae bacterium]